MNITLQKRLLVGFVLALAAQAFAGVLLQRNNAAFRAAQTRLAHAHEVTEALQQFLASAEDAETGQRGYVLTGDASYLNPTIRPNPKSFSASSGSKTWPAMTPPANRG